MKSWLMLSIAVISKNDMVKPIPTCVVFTQTYKFKTVGGNLLLVNLRKEAQARAEASFHESRLAFMETLLSYKALISTAE